MKRIQGIAAARGYAIGPAYIHRPARLEVERRSVEDAPAELRRLDAALAAAEAQLQLTIERARLEMPAEEAAIFEAHAMMLKDPSLLGAIRKTITDEKLNAEFAVQQAAEHFAGQLEALDDEYLKARAADVRDVGRSVLRMLLGAGTTALDKLASPCIVVAQDLAPSDTVMLDKRMVLGFCTAEGSGTSHTAILARTLGIPAVVGAGTGILSIEDGTALIVDGSAGEVLLDAPADVIEEYRSRDRSLASSHQEAQKHAHEPAITVDGRRLEVVANIGSVADASRAVQNGAEGVGLLRTEFLYLERASLPDEAEQTAAYSTILQAFGSRPVVLRTLDIGGDKAIAYLNMPQESNSFLGTRGLRLCLRRPDLFRPQLRAALRASAGQNLKIMFPMVAAIEEVLQARAVLDECRDELRREGVPFAERIETGIMIEVPSAAILAERFAPHVDFFSIGTNDLTQYTLAADRTNPALAYLTSAFSPAVLRLIDGVIRAAHAHGKWAGVCGELAGEPLALPILLGMGLDEFSMNAPAIPLAKQTLRRLDARLCADLAQRCLGQDDAQSVQKLVLEEYPWLGAL